MLWFFVFFVSTIISWTLTCAFFVRYKEGEIEKLKQTIEIDEIEIKELLKTNEENNESFKQLAEMYAREKRKNELTYGN